MSKAEKRPNGGEKMNRALPYISKAHSKEVHRGEDTQKGLKKSPEMVPRACL